MLKSNTTTITRIIIIFIIFNVVSGLSCNSLINICSKDAKVRSTNTSDPSQFCAASCAAYHVCTSTKEYTDDEVLQYFNCPLEDLKLEMKRYLYEVSFNLRINCHHQFLETQPVALIGGSTLKEGGGGLVRYLQEVCPDMNNIWPNVPLFKYSNSYRINYYTIIPIILFIILS